MTNLKFRDHRACEQRQTDCQEILELITPHLDGSGLAIELTSLGATTSRANQLFPRVSRKAKLITHLVEALVSFCHLSLINAKPFSKRLHDSALVKIVQVDHREPVSLRDGHAFLQGRGSWDLGQVEDDVPHRILHEGHCRLPTHRHDTQGRSDLP